MRCAALWHELWFNALTDASKFHFEEDDTPGEQVQSSLLSAAEKRRAMASRELLGKRKRVTQALSLALGFIWLCSTLWTPSPQRTRQGQRQEQMPSSGSLQALSIPISACLGMEQRLEEAHALTATPTTPREIAFHQAFNGDLHQAHSWLLRYKSTRSRGDLNSAW